ncbi:hypothetical protein LTR72_012159 [Exophiala xenobiotica]|nr:hypothetical protein LTR72_012159 [Exophiala xenobiotica]KAK5454691.1 hypothetical protein LTR55_012123 [Exophiala xenobiotica]KAK5550555.1 hypothetical protein LTR46_011437 [Exophiala xenobiotica]
MTITVYADELLRLTVDDIGDEDFFDIKDRENETEEHVAHLRKLCYERAEKDRSRPVDGGELGARLGRLPSRDSPIPRSSRYRSPSTSTIDTEKDREGGWKEEEEAYRALVAEGGRPSHPVTLGYDVVDNPDRYKPYKEILWFWHFRGAGYYQEFRYQLIEWREFREMQDKKRSYYVPRNRFQEYQDSVRESQADAGWKYDLRVLEHRHQQTRLEDWNEFRALYYRRLKACEKRVPPAEEDLSMYQRKFEDAQARLTDVITDPQVIYGRFDDIRASEKEVTAAKSRVESAEKALQATKQNKSKRKAALMRIAHQEVASARDNLKKVSGSEELRRLRDGFELHITRRSMIRSKAELNGAERDVQRWKVFLKWIDDQYPVVAAECGLFASGTSHRPLPASVRRSQPHWPARYRKMARACRWVFQLSKEMVTIAESRGCRHVSLSRHYNPPGVALESRKEDVYKIPMHYLKL